MTILCKEYKSSALRSTSGIFKEEPWSSQNFAIWSKKLSFILVLASNSFNLCILGTNLNLSTSTANGGCQFCNKPQCFMNIHINNIILIEIIKKKIMIFISNKDKYIFLKGQALKSISAILESRSYFISTMVITYSRSWASSMLHIGAVSIRGPYLMYFNM